MEGLVIDIVRNFYLTSGAMESEFDINDFNISFIESVVDEQIKISVE